MSSPLLRLTAALLLAGAVSSSPVWSQGTLRTLPDAPRGTLSFVTGTVLSLNGKQVKLAPGGQIRGANNLIITPGSVPRNARVKYQLDAQGQLLRAWILTPEEAAKADAANARPAWSTSPETGTAIEQITGQRGTQQGMTPIGQRPGETPPDTNPAVPGQSNNP